MYFNFQIDKKRFLSMNGITERKSMWTKGAVLLFVELCLVCLTAATDLARGPLCYSCETMLAPYDCANVIQCGRDEFCMLHETRIGSDGRKRFTAKCASNMICNAVQPHSKRATGHMYCHLCCDTDHCNNKCGVTPTTPAPLTTAPLFTFSSTPITQKPTTQRPTTQRPTTQKATTSVSTGHTTGKNIMCYECDNMKDPKWCSHITLCPKGNGCLIQQSGVGVNGEALYKSSCERDVMCFAVALYGKKKRGADDIEEVVGTNGTISDDVKSNAKRGIGCAKCCYTSLCNNGCENPTTTTSTTTTTTPAPTTTSKVVGIPQTNPLHLNYKGCFTDYGGTRLPYYQTSDIHMTIEKCIKHCKTRGYMYAGVTARTSCHCGSNGTHLDFPSVDSQCDIPCGGNSSQYCGSNIYVSVYDTNTLCYSCNYVVHPDECTHVVKCTQDEECILYETEDHLLFGAKKYHAGCALRKVCHTLGTIQGTQQNSATEFCHTCCDTPMCNNMCINTTFAPVTQAPGTHLTSTLSLNMAQQLCEKNDYTYISSVHLCYKTETFQYNRDLAQKWCEVEGGTLANLSDQAKFSILQMLLKYDSKFAGKVLLTGGYDVNDNNHYTWPTGEAIIPGQWTGLTTSGAGRCLAFDGAHHFMVRSVNCNSYYEFICTKEI
ncbi:hypothetical protein ACF0H5_024411 [Mactra antiquata]